ncbi:putative transcriptional regulator [cyanobacterium endosymbiont of Rhopalodia gibberula]|uniref:transposase n=1 Tax=cyanobacterium endosymbiont of Rhopalodia gibberula TaxID=1763363 RepID=UPI000DC6D505|nr:transposase [cyanobacterium endosymbiont of Rhopalodia gibberula]BBA79441.1 putative transcriptional regulator [cyanobacterium endosymbiont of Rhopalodia gibberula]
MSPKKLNDDDKQEILKLYRQTPETTSTLADRYGVSSSTISRFLKSYLSESEYEELIQQKRLARTAKSELLSTQTYTKPVLMISESQSESQTSKTKGELVLVTSKNQLELSSTETSIKQPPILAKDQSSRYIQHSDEEDEEDDLEMVDVIALGEMIGEDLSDGIDDEDLDDEDLDDEDWDEIEEENYDQSLAQDGDVQVLPLSSAIFPKTCYLVIDRSAELIARPLKEFAHLGQIPAEEVQQKTLPVFDNHQGARRFSNRSQRVIKVPDGRLLYKSCPHLYAKGITRLLMDGQIYSIGSNYDN